MRKTITATDHRPAILTLRGPALLTVDQKAVKLRRKGLALLYYLAVEGPTRRERLADVLWGHNRALQNLRVELHRLKDSLEPFGIEPFSDGSDPLTLSGVKLEAATGANRGPDSADAADIMFDGLDDISPEYQEWLERQRAAALHLVDGHARTALVDELAHTITPPYVLILAGEPGSGRRSVAMDLAGRLGLPFVDGCSGSGPAVRYVVAEDASCSDVAAAIERDDSCVWVLQRSLFGEDEDVVLRLRAAVPPERMQFRTLEPLDWWSVKSTLPDDVKFIEGARLFLASGGNQQYLSELLELRKMVGPGSTLPVPLRMRAAFALEARKLGDGARHALERASIHRGSLSRELLTAVGATTHLEELERNGWLTFQGVGWRFTSELSRRMLEGQLREGTKRRLHAEVAEALEKRGVTVEASYHRNLSLGTTSYDDAATTNDLEHREPAITHVGVGRERWLDDGVINGHSIRLDGDRVTFSRTEASCPSSRVAYSLEPEALLLRVRGRAYTEDGGVTASGTAHATLTLTVTGSTARAVHLVHGTAPRFGPAGQLCLPLEQRFTYWFLAPAGRELHLESTSSAAVIELKVNAYSPLATTIDDAPTCTIVEAYALDGFSRHGGDDVGPRDPHGDGERLVDHVVVWS